MSILIILIIISALLVILSKNPMHSVLSLVMTFVLSSILMINLGVEFLALLFLIVYVGAIAILFLFVVMMLNINLEELLDNTSKYAPISVIVGTFLALELNYVMEINPYNWETISYIDWSKSFNGFDTNILLLGQYLYTEYYLYFIIASMVLLVSMIGAIILTLKHEENILRQDIFEQINR